MILYHAADLLWATRIKKTGESEGISCRPVRSVEMLDARLADSPVRGLILDLDSAAISLDLIRALRDGSRDPGRAIKILAFGPHVATELFEQARAAGADQVMARGAFDKGLAAVLRAIG